MAASKNESVQAKIDNAVSCATETTNILTSALYTGSAVRYFVGSGDSYTGNVLDSNMKYGIFVVIPKYSNRYVISICGAGLFSNSYSSSGGVWGGWRRYTFTTT
jgi:hypothetical protein